jgi:hypothetical protein
MNGRDVGVVLIPFRAAILDRTAVLESRAPACRANPTRSPPAGQRERINLEDLHKANKIKICFYVSTFCRSKTGRLRVQLKRRLAPGLKLRHEFGWNYSATNPGRRGLPLQR